MAEITLADLAKARAGQEPPDEMQNKIVKAEAQAPDFTEEEKKRIGQIRASIDLMDSQAVVQYGVGAQRNLSDFADTVLSNKARDILALHF